MADTNQQPHIVLITCHDLGQHIGCYGVDAVDTPALDGLAASGVQFENAVSTTPVCSPARGSLLTGRYPQSNGLIGLTHSPWWWEIDDAEETLPELLGETGYETHLAGFQHVVSNADCLGFDHHHSQERDAEETAAAAADVFADPDGPVYAQFGFFETHRSFDREPADGEVFVPDYLEPTAKMSEDLRRFQAEIEYFDNRVGELLNGLEAAGVRDEAIIVFTTDHGIPYPGAKWWCRDPGVEVAMLMDGPGPAFAADTPVTDPISHVDLLPTLLDLAGVPISDRVEGESFRAYLASEVDMAPRDAAFTQYTNAGKEARGIVTQDYILIRNFGAGRTVNYPVDADPTDRAPSLPPSAGPRPYAQLYDRAEDPYNLDDIANECEAVVEELSDRVRGWMARIDDPLLRGGIRYPYQDRARKDLLGAGE